MAGLALARRRCSRDLGSTIRAWRRAQRRDRTGGETFNWNQTYGPLDCKGSAARSWRSGGVPATGRRRHSTRLTGARGWKTDTPAERDRGELPADPATLARWTQQLHHHPGKPRLDADSSPRGRRPRSRGRPANRWTAPASGASARPATACTTALLRRNRLLAHTGRRRALAASPAITRHAAQLPRPADPTGGHRRCGPPAGDHLEVAFAPFAPAAPPRRLAGERAARGSASSCAG